MKIFIYGNCQAVALKHTFDYIFSDCDYNIMAVQNYTLLNGWQLLTEEIINFVSSADLIVYQPLSIEYDKFSTDFKVGILKFASPNCKFVSFQYIYNNGFWPFFYNGNSIQWLDDFKLKYASYSKDDLLILYDKNMLSVNFNDKVHSSIELLNDREKSTNVDIKLTDYILNNYKNKMLFLTQNHPTSFIFGYIFEKICDLFGLSYSDTRLEEYFKEINQANLPGYNPYLRIASEELGLKFICLHNDETKSKNHYRKFINDNF